MSLVNLSHVCSHLQNASLARLGLTSIPYTRLHLSLSLLLQKQGFLSTVKLAGPSPPASSFPPGTENHRFLTSALEAERRGYTPEAALQWIVEQGSAGTAEALRQKGFGEAAIEFAMDKRLKGKEQLLQEGVNGVVANFLLRNYRRSPEQMREAEIDESAITMMERYRPQLTECEQRVRQWYGDRAKYDEDESQAARDAGRARRPYDVVLRRQMLEQVSRIDFEIDVLRHFAGENQYQTWRELTLDGIDVDVAGVTVRNQPLDVPPPEHAADPWQLEEEGVVTQANRASRRLWLGMKYYDGLPVLRKATMLSKPKKRIRFDASNLAKLVRGKRAGEVQPLSQVGEIIAVDTQMGVLEVREAVERKLGGQVLCRVW